MGWKGSVQARRSAFYGYGVIASSVHLRIHYLIRSTGLFGLLGILMCICIEKALACAWAAVVQGLGTHIGRPGVALDGKFRDQD